VTAAAKNWDRHVRDAETVARGPGFVALRDRVLELASPQSGDIAVDLGAGTGLLTLALAPDVERVWAIDNSAGMVEYLRVRAESAELDNVRVVLASATHVPLVDDIADLVVSNYCFHEMTDVDKGFALSEASRLLRAGGRLVIGDMMFTLSPLSSRDRRIVAGKLRAIARRGIPGLLRIVKNAARVATGRWEHPSTADWWHTALAEHGFDEICLELFEHEGGIVVARRLERELNAMPTSSATGPKVDLSVATPRAGADSRPRSRAA